MDLDLKIELRLWLKSHGLPAKIELDGNGLWLTTSHRGKQCRLPLPDEMEGSILNVLDDVTDHFR